MPNKSPAEKKELADKKKKLSQSQLAARQWKSENKPEMKNLKAVAASEKTRDAKFAETRKKVAEKRKAAASKPATSSAPKKVESKPKSSKFGSAFAAARKAGKSTFEWNGKKYTTEMKGEKKKAGKSKPNQSKAPPSQKKATPPKGPTKAPNVGGVFKKKEPDAKALAAKRKARGDMK